MCWLLHNMHNMHNMHNLHNLHNNLHNLHNLHNIHNMHNLHNMYNLHNYLDDFETFLWRSRKRKNVSEKTPSVTKKPKVLRNLEDDQEVEEDDSFFASGEVRKNSRGLPLTPTGRPSIKLNEVNRKFTPKYLSRGNTKRCSASPCRWAAQWLCRLRSDMDLSCLQMNMARSSVKTLL